MINTIIIDDEPKSVFTLNSFLQEYCPIVNVMGTAGDADAGKELITKVQPQLVFLDVEMPYASGFDLLQSLDEINFEIIFITAYNKYALNAFRFSALDYLLKPLRITELEEAVKKAQVRIQEKQTMQDYKLLLQNLNEKNPAKQKIALTDKGEKYIVDVSNIKYCISIANYTQIYTNEKRFISAKSLVDYEEMLPPELFFRIHKSHIVNINFISKIIDGRGGSVLMKDGKELEIAVRRKDDFMKVFMK